VKSSHIKFYGFIFHLDELILSYQFVNDGPASFGPRQELIYSLLSHRVHGGDIQQVFLNVARESKSVTFITSDIITDGFFSHNK